MFVCILRNCLSCEADPISDATRATCGLFRVRVSGTGPSKSAMLGGLMRAFVSSLILLAALGVGVACSSDDDGPSGAGGSNAGGAASSTASTASCSPNPGPGDTCTGSGTCATASNCFCLSGSISCSEAPPPTGGNQPGGNQPGGSQSSDGGSVDCGNNPQDGDNCSGGPGRCEGSFRCFCDSSDEVQCN